MFDPCRDRAATVSEMPGQRDPVPTNPRRERGRAERCHTAGMDQIDRTLVRLLHQDARSTYQDLGREVRLSANTVAERVRRLRTRA